jgi:hypothetical protein
MNIVPWFWKERLSIDGQQFHQYQQNYLNITLEFQFLAWDRHINVVGLNQLMGSQASSW